MKVFQCLLFLSFSFLLTHKVLAKKNQKITGKIEAWIEDDFEEKISEIKFYLLPLEENEISSENRIELKFNKKNPEIKNGQKTEITCSNLENKLCQVETWSSDENAEKSSSPLIGEMNILWVLVHASDVQNNLNYDEAKAKIDMTRSWFQNASENKLDINTDIDGDGNYDLFEVTVEDYSKEADGCKAFSLGGKALKLLEERGVDLSLYKYRFFIIPKLGCSFGGVANLGCSDTCQAYSHGGNWNLVYPHELSHNLGRMHASTDPDNNGSANKEYGDGTCPMGNKLSKGYFNPPHSIRMGWLTEEEGSVQKITEKVANYTLPSMNDSSNRSPRILTIDGSRVYYLSYRPGSDFDKPMDQYKEGVLLHSIKKAGTYSNSMLIKTIKPGEINSNRTISY